MGDGTGAGGAVSATVGAGVAGAGVGDGTGEGVGTSTGAGVGDVTGAGRPPPFVIRSDTSMCPVVPGAVRSQWALAGRVSGNAHGGPVMYCSLFENAFLNPTPELALAGSSRGPTTG